MKRFHWFEVTLIAVIMGIHLYAAFSAPHNFSMRWFTRDDAYYYFKVAQNIAEGHGSTFDGINLSNGYHPLWMLVCVPIFALARFDLILPLRILLVVTAAIGATTSVLLFRLLKKVVPQPVAMLAAAFWGLSTLVHEIIVQPGMETGITALSIVLFLYALQKFDTRWRDQKIRNRDIAILALAAVFVLFSRLDSIYLALIGGIWIIFRRTPIRYLLPIDLFLTFSIVVIAFIQRAELEVYLLVFTNSAIISAAVLFAIQTVTFYLIGLYQHPKSQSITAILRKSLLGVTISALIGSLVILGLSALGLIDLPRAVPVLYWVGALLTTLLSRLTLRAVSASPISNDNAAAPAPMDQLRQTGRAWLAEGTTYYGILSAALGIYLLINKWMFGTPLPVSGQVKKWWGSLPNNVYGGGAKSIPDLFAIDPANSQAWGLLTRPVQDWASQFSQQPASINSISWVLLLALLALTLALLLRDRPATLKRMFQTAFIPLLVSAELQVFLYGAMAYAGEQEWYWTMQMFTLVILGALVSGSLLDALPASKYVDRVAWIISGSVCIYMAFIFVTTIYNRMPYQDQWAGQPYMDMLPILEGYTQPGSIIGMTGGGNAGYFIKDRTVVNMDGLINSYAYFQAMQDGRAGRYLKKMGMTYVFGSYYILTETMPYGPNLAGRLQQIPGVPSYGHKELLRLLPTP